MSIHKRHYVDGWTRKHLADLTFSECPQITVKLFHNPRCYSSEIHAPGTLIHVLTADTAYRLLYEVRHHLINNGYMPLY